MTNIKPDFQSQVQCPCCNQKVAAPTVEILIDALAIAPQSARILEALWKGKGRAVPTQRIYDAIWSDDPDGGPPEARMRANFQWSLNDLRERLKGSGWSVENVYYNQGYRLVAEPVKGALPA